MNPMALADMCDCLAMALHCAETVRAGAGDERAAIAETSFLEASLAAAGAFPEGSPGAAALDVLFGEISADLNGVRS